MSYYSYPESDKATNLSYLSSFLIVIALIAFGFICLCMGMQFYGKSAFDMASSIKMSAISGAVLLITSILAIWLRKKARIVNIRDILKRAYSDFEYARYIAFFYPQLREWMMNEIRGDYNFDRPVTNYKAIKMEQDRKKGLKSSIIFIIIIVVAIILLAILKNQSF